MRRASARSSTTTSARARGRILATEWPVAVLAAAAAVALALLLGARRRPVAELLVAVCGAALVTSAFGLADFLFSSREAGSRLSEPLGYPNALGLVAAIGALLAVSFAAHAGSRVRRALAAACVVVFVLTIFFTYSRGTWISLAVGVVAMAVVDPRRLAPLRTAPARAPVPRP